MNILLVDSDSSIRNELSKFFTESGHTVIEAENGRDGILKYYTIGSTYFDIIVTETDLPGISGRDMAKRIKDSYLGSKVPILAISSDFEKDYSAKADSIFSLVLPKDISNAKVLDFCLLVARWSKTPTLCRVA
ncbi:response regulator [Aquiflexum sp. TKW24L]|uniref:response regulator n=1 Tax=Aquiflexum sp. TKW24L TaxID=2942212 RepID=UPI0020C0441A|nr:response regulator [Aquiflexum sp. TKW24L]MCL6260818.1 response regulator [Aquiflexum sp. TKW24L]